MSDEVIAALEAAARRTPSMELKVGVFEDAVYPDGTSVAQVAAWQEYGEGAIPPRPTFRPAIAEHKSEWVEELDAAFLAGASTKDALTIIGEAGKGEIVANIFAMYDPPLAERTLKARRKRGNLSEKPLIDTKRFVKAIDYEVLSDGD